MRARSLGQPEPREKGTAPNSSTLAWRIPWTEEPGGLQSTGSQRVRHGIRLKHLHTCTHTSSLCLTSGDQKPLSVQPPYSQMLLITKLAALCDCQGPASTSLILLLQETSWIVLSGWLPRLAEHRLTESCVIISYVWNVHLISGARLYDLFGGDGGGEKGSRHSL